MGNKRTLINKLSALAVSALLLCLSVDVLAHSTPIWGDVVSNPPPATPQRTVAALDKKAPHRIVALTFDDGPDPRFTPQVLSILKAKGAKATFFLIGRSVQKYPNLALQEMLQGNEIGNHTFTHADMRKAGWTDTVSEISRCQDEIMSVTGLRTHYFRPPRGEFDVQDVEAAKAMGYRIVMWTVGIENHAMKSPQAMVERVVDKIQSGSVILLHDGELDRSKTVAALPILLDRLKGEGYSFVTVSELLEATGEKNKQDLEIIDRHSRLPVPLRLFPYKVSPPKIKVTP